MFASKHFVTVIYQILRYKVNIKMFYFGTWLSQRKTEARLSINLEYGNKKETKIWPLKAIEFLMLKFTHPLIHSIEMCYLKNHASVFICFKLTLKFKSTFIRVFDSDWYLKISKSNHLYWNSFSVFKRLEWETECWFIPSHYKTL